MKKVRGWIVLVPLEDEHFLVLVQESKTTRGDEGLHSTIVFASQKNQQFLSASRFQGGIGTNRAKPLGEFSPERLKQLIQTMG